MRFPLWPYLNQPVFNRYHRTIYNPRSFWSTYRISFLERCWLREYCPKKTFEQDTHG